MSPAARVGALTAVYAACLALFVVVAIGGDSRRAESEGFAIGGALLAAVVLVLGDMRWQMRSLALVLSAGSCLALLIPILATDTSDQFHLLSGSGKSVARPLFAMFWLVVGMLLVVRVYLGTIGLVRADQRRRVTLLAILGLTSYFALSALVFSLDIPRDEAQRGELLLTNVIGALAMSVACVAPVLAGLGQSMKVRMLGAALFLGMLALLAWGLSEAWSDPLFWRMALALGGLLLTPCAGVVVMRANGYRLRH